MSLSLIPSADRLAADARVSNQAPCAKKGASSDSGTYASEFALLVDDADTDLSVMITMVRSPERSTIKVATADAPEVAEKPDESQTDIVPVDPQLTPSFPTIGLPLNEVLSAQGLSINPSIDSPEIDPEDSVDAPPTTAQLSSFASDNPDIWAEPASDARPVRTAEMAAPLILHAPVDQTLNPADTDHKFNISDLSAMATGAQIRTGPESARQIKPLLAVQDQNFRQTAFLTRTGQASQFTGPGASSAELVGLTAQPTQAANHGGAEIPSTETPQLSKLAGIYSKRADLPDRQPVLPVLTTLNDLAATAATTDPSTTLQHSERNPQLFAAYAAMSEHDQPTPSAHAEKTLIPYSSTGTNAKAADRRMVAVGPEAPTTSDPDPLRQNLQELAEFPGLPKTDAHAPAVRPKDQPRQYVDRVTTSVAAEGLMPDSFGLTQTQSENQRQELGLRTADATQSGRDTAAHIAMQVAHAASQTSSGTTDITLNPKELGHVKLSLQAVDGTMFVAIAVERPETAELMRRHIDSLAQEFRALGYQDVSFSFSGRQGGNGSGPDPGFGRPGNPELAQQTETGTDLPADRYIPRRAAAQTGSTGLDLRL